MGEPGERIEVIKPRDEMCYPEVAPNDQSVSKWYRCSNCKKPIDINDNYCRYCGLELINVDNSQHAIQNDYTTK